jgi:hypothetical protein
VKNLCQRHFIHHKSHTDWSGIERGLRGDRPATSRLIQRTVLNTKFNLNYTLNIQSVPRSKHSVSVIQTSHLTLYREIIAVCSEIHTKHINTLCGQNIELLNIKLVVHIVTTGLCRVKRPPFPRTAGGVSQPAQSACSYWKFFLTIVVWTAFLGDWRAYSAVSGRVEASFMSSIFEAERTTGLHTTTRFPSFITLFTACSFFPSNLSNQPILISKVSTKSDLILKIAAVSVWWRVGRQVRANGSGETNGCNEDRARAEGGVLLSRWQARR